MSVASVRKLLAEKALCYKRETLFTELYELTVLSPSKGFIKKLFNVHNFFVFQEKIHLSTFCTCLNKLPQNEII